MTTEQKRPLNLGQQNLKQRKSEQQSLEQQKQEIENLNRQIADQQMFEQEYVIETLQGQVFVKTWKNINTKDLSPLILFHDSLGSVELWRDFPEKIAQITGRTVYAYDRIGFGQSSAHPSRLSLDFIATEAENTFSELMQYFQWSSCVVMGHSVGGGMASHVAAYHAPQVRALITIAAQSCVEEKTLAGILEAKANFTQVGQMERLAKYHAEKAPWVLEAWTETWCDPKFASWNLDDALRQLKCPSLVIHGELDEYGSISQAEQFAKLSPSLTQVEILKGLHHIPYKEDEALVLDLIQQFLKDIA